tara:strand:- start:399 stop:632 length:234 start_codon:yes stop_codon:yes gene_type:complete
MTSNKAISLQCLLDNEYTCKAFVDKAVRSVAKKEGLTDNGVRVLMLSGDDETIHQVELYTIYYAEAMIAELSVTKEH